MSLAEQIRKDNPKFASKTDDQLLEAYRIKYYPDKSLDELENAFANAEKRRQKEKTDELGIIGSFGRGLYRGKEQTKGLLTDVLPAIGAHVFGAEDYRDRQMQEYNERM